MKSLKDLAALVLGFELTGLILAGFALGHFSDKFLHTQGLLTVVFCMLALSLWVYRVFLFMKKRDSERQK